jgi:hypothetical protein
MSSLFGYFIKAGDDKVSELIAPLIWGREGILSLLESVSKKDYGRDLELVLIQYYVEGEFPVHGPEEMKVGRYSSKEKNIAVAITVHKHNFHNLERNDRKDFVSKTSLDAFEAVAKKLSKRKLYFDFENWINDIKEVIGVKPKEL